MRHSRANSRRAGFTLTELVVVMLIMGVLGAVAVGSIESLSSTRLNAAAHAVTRDLAYARERTMATGTRHWVSFSVADSSYSVLTESATTPGFANATSLRDPATGMPLVTRLNTGEFAGVSIASVSFDGGTTVGFDWLGRPLATTGSRLTSAAQVIIGTRTILIDLSSGRIVGGP